MRDAVLTLGGWAGPGRDSIYGLGLRPSTLARETAKVPTGLVDLCVHSLGTIQCYIEGNSDAKREVVAMI